jgi:hypothetical protein
MADIDENGIGRNGSIEDLHSTWKKKSSSSYAFIVDELEPCSANSISRSEIKSRYHLYCAKNRITPEDGRLYHKLYEMIEGLAEGWIDKERYFMGLKFKNPENEIAQNIKEGESQRLLGTV